MKHLALFAFALISATTTIHAQQPTPAPPAGYVTAFERTPVKQSLAAQQSGTSNRIAFRLTGGERMLLANYTALYNEVWHNADGLTPQQVCDALGSKAANLFIIAGTLANALYQIDPAGIGSLVSVPPGWTDTIHADGTVTLTYTAPTPSP